MSSGKQNIVADDNAFRINRAVGFSRRCDVFASKIFVIGNTCNLVKSLGVGSVADVTPIATRPKTYDNADLAVNFVDAESRSLDFCGFTLHYLRAY